MGGGGHFRVYFQGRLVTTLTATARDIGHRRQNELAILRRAGIPI